MSIFSKYVQVIPYYDVFTVYSNPKYPIKMAITFTLSLRAPSEALGCAPSETLGQPPSESLGGGTLLITSTSALRNHS